MHPYFILESVVTGPEPSL